MQHTTLGRAATLVAGTKKRGQFERMLKYVLGSMVSVAFVFVVIIFGVKLGRGDSFGSVIQVPCALSPPPLLLSFAKSMRTEKRKVPKQTLAARGGGGGGFHSGGHAPGHPERPVRGRSPLDQKGGPGVQAVRH